MMNQTVQQVINHFPSQEAYIWQLWQSDKDFQELCQDYALCLETLKHWSGVAATQQAEEYIVIRRHLEFEIALKIENQKEIEHEN